MPKARTIAFLVAAATTSLFDHNDSALAQAQPCRSREYAHNASNGRLHPRFDRGSTSLKARTGAGARADGNIIFAISHGEVSFDGWSPICGPPTSKDCNWACWRRDGCTAVSA